MMLFLSTLVGVFLLGFQNQNVVGGHYWLAAIGSACIALTQFLIYNGAVGGDAWSVLEMALGGSIGITSSMYVHRRWVKKEKKNGR